MMKWFFLLGWIIPIPVIAQQINVRSGAHENFTRLVLDTPEGILWKLENLTTGVRLVLNGHTGGFDISSIFNRIDRTFVSKVMTSDSSISVEFSCLCIAKSFAAGTRMIVLDIKAKPKEENVEIHSLTPTLPTQDKLLSIELSQAVEIEKSLKNRIEYSGSLRSQTELPHPQILPPKPILNLKKNANEYQNIQTRLHKQIGAAATQGLLKLSFSEAEFTRPPPHSTINYRTFFSSIAEKHQVPNATSTIDNVKITNSSGVQKTILGSIDMQAPIGGPCIDSNLVTVQNWQPEIDFPTDVGMLRGRLFRELDKLDSKAAIALSQLYLYYGFGAEAKQILHLDESLVRANPSLIAIAEIMEYGHSRRSTYLENFANCDGAVALWSILSTPNFNPVKAINVDAALLNLSGLPMHLRKIVAPDLSRRFLTYGDKIAAAAALHSLERSPAPLAPNANFAKASLQLVQGEIGGARKRLSQVIESNSEKSAEALITFVTSHLNTNDEIGHEVVVLLDSYAQEMRDSPLGDELARMHVLALGKTGHFSEAFASFSNLKSRHEEINEGPLFSSLIDILVRDASDFDFLKFAFLYILPYPESIPAETRFFTAERFVNLGFYEQGEIILSPNPAHPKNGKKSLLEAEISMALSRPHEALAHLFDETSERAKILRAQAETDLGEFSKAHSIYSDIGDEMNSHRTAWLSDNWTALIKEEVPVFGATVGVSRAALNHSVELDGMLNRTTLAISESQSARKTIEDLLNLIHLSILEK